MSRKRGSTVLIVSPDGNQEFWIKRETARQLEEEGMAFRRGGKLWAMPNVNFEDTYELRKNLPEAQKPRRSCMICGFDRTLQRAHIIPDRLQGPYADWNLLDLCNNHHWLFDRDGLQNIERQMIVGRVKDALLRGIKDSRFAEWCRKTAQIFRIEDQVYA